MHAIRISRGARRRTCPLAISKHGPACLRSRRITERKAEREQAARGKPKRKDLRGVTEKDGAVNILDVLPADRVSSSASAKGDGMQLHAEPSPDFILQLRLCRRGESEKGEARERARDRLQRESQQSLQAMEHHQSGRVLEAEYFMEPLDERYVRSTPKSGRHVSRERDDNRRKNRPVALQQPDEMG